jgi:hypothetical protein
LRDEYETGPSREDIVDRLYDSLTADDVCREKMDLGYKGLISQTVVDRARPVAVQQFGDDDISALHGLARGSSFA